MPNDNISRPLPAWAARPPDTLTRRIAKRLHGLARQGQGHAVKVLEEDRIKVVCISDTHTATPFLPDGDIFLHAGDLSNYGSFAEIQAALDWIKSLPHRHKVVIGGNHDAILDSIFVEANPVRELGRFDKSEGRRKEDLDWGDIIYLEDEAVTLTVNVGCGSGCSSAASDCSCKDKKMERSASSDASLRRVRQVKIYGSPQTPISGTFGFQYDQEQEDFWTGRIPPDTDILLTHGPPKFYLDEYLGCHQLLREVWRSRPGVVVFGHIHSGHGEKLMVYDSVQHWYEKILDGEENPAALFVLASHTILNQFRRLLPSRSCKDDGDGDVECKRKTTRLVNAAFRSGRTTFEAMELEI